MLSFSDPVAIATFWGPIVAVCLTAFLARGAHRRDRSGPPRDPEKESQDAIYHGLTVYVHSLEVRIAELVHLVEERDLTINRLERKIGRLEGQARRRRGEPPRRQ